MSQPMAHGLQPLRVLFLCTHNSSRSQMAEGLLRARGGDAYEVFSAGTEPRVVHPLAIKVMREIGIDISDHRAKSLEVFRDQPPMDLVITVCDEAAEACPYFPHARRQVHWGFSDPSRVEGSEEERLAAFRRARDLIAARVEQFLALQPAISLEKLHAAARKIELALRGTALETRSATPQDATAIAEIYNQGIEDRVATFETEPRTAAMVQTWFDERHPIVVVEHQGAIVAYASTSSYRSRACYAGIAEFSVYVRRAWRGMGAGRLAMEQLIQECAAAGFWKLVSRVFVENTASRNLLRSLGFREVGVYEKHGQLDGIWRDVVIVERLLETI